VLGAEDFCRGERSDYGQFAVVFQAVGCLRGGAAEAKSHDTLTSAARTAVCPSNKPTPHRSSAVFDSAISCKVRLGLCVFAKPLE
jgi:hypothetical protein